MFTKDNVEPFDCEGLMPTKKPLRRILRSVLIGTNRYRATTDTGTSFIIEYDDEGDGWCWYHEGDDLDDPNAAMDTGFWTQQDCIEGLRDYLATMPFPPPGLILTGTRMVRSA